MNQSISARSALALALLTALLQGCINLRIGPDEEFFTMKGVANIHGTLGGLNHWDGSFLDIGLFTNTRGRGEILSVEIGPLAGFGIGLLGARARVLPLEIGIGTLFYDPRGRPKAAPEPSELPKPTWPEDDAEGRPAGDPAEDPAEEPTTNPPSQSDPGAEKAAGSANAPAG